MSKPHRALDRPGCECIEGTAWSSDSHTDLSRAWCVHVSCKLLRINDIFGLTGRGDGCCFHRNDKSAKGSYYEQPIDRLVNPEARLLFWLQVHFPKIFRGSRGGRHPQPRRGALSVVEFLPRLGIHPIVIGVCQTRSDPDERYISEKHPMRVLHL